MAVITLLNVQCQSSIKTEKQTVKVDFDFSGRRLSEVHDPLYQPWVINEEKQTEKSFEEVTVKLKGNFKSNWVKIGMSAPHYAQLVSDGVVSENPLEVTILGLKSGKHTLLTYHNTFSNLKGRTVTPIKIFIGDKLVETLNQSNRAFAKIDATTSYLNLEVIDNKPVTIRFEGENGFDISQFVINGFEIDTPNLKKQANTPQPENADEHVVVEENLNLTEEWDL